MKHQFLLYTGVAVFSEWQNKKKGCVKKGLHCDGIVHSLCEKVVWLSVHSFTLCFTGIAFPTCVSVNNCVCHHSPLRSDPDVILKDGDLVKMWAAKFIPSCALDKLWFVLMPGLISPYFMFSCSVVLQWSRCACWWLHLKCGPQPHCWSDQGMSSLLI